MHKTYFFIFLNNFGQAAYQRLCVFSYFVQWQLQFFCHDKLKFIPQLGQKKKRIMV